MGLIEFEGEGRKFSSERFGVGTCSRSIHQSRCKDPYQSCSCHVQSTRVLPRNHHHQVYLLPMGTPSASSPDHGIHHHTYIPYAYRRPRGWCTSHQPRRQGSSVACKSHVPSSHWDTAYVHMPCHRSSRSIDTLHCYDRKFPCWNTPRVGGPSSHHLPSRSSTQCPWDTSFGSNHVPSTLDHRWGGCSMCTCLKKQKGTEKSEMVELELETNSSAK